MSEGSRWMPMSGSTPSSRMFGIYREPDSNRRSRINSRVNCKIVILLVVLAASALLVCFVSVRLTGDRYPADGPLEENQKRSPLPTQQPNGDGEGTSPAWSNSTSFGDSGGNVQETLGRPTGGQLPTENYPVGSHPVSFDLEAAAAVVRTAGERKPEPRRPRAFPDGGEAKPVSAEARLVEAGIAEEPPMARIINRKRFGAQPDQVAAGTGMYAQPPSFTDQYPQLEGYRSPVRGLQDVMSWVDRPTAGLKFSGVYFKAEEADKPYLNGHAYVSDPFVKFKPSHPAEINQLAVEQPDRGTRFSNRPDTLTVGTHTQAVFHPFRAPIRPKPLKIMLDIYPMLPEQPALPDHLSGPDSQAADPRGRRQRLAPITAPGNNRMIVHLNLYPKRNARISRRRPGLGEEVLLQQRMFEGSTGTEPWSWPDIPESEGEGTIEGLPGDGEGYSIVTTDAATTVEEENNTQPPQEH